MPAGFDTPCVQTYPLTRFPIMPAALPYSKHTPGRTFVIAISVLGLVALAQVGVLGWAFVKRAQSGLPVTMVAGTTGSDLKPDAAETEKEPEVLAVNDPFEDAKGNVTLDNPADPIMPPAKPQPVPMARLQLAPDSRIGEMLQQGRALRDRGDTNNALLRFREAQASDPKSPEVISEIAVTLEKMGLPDKAAENWKRVYDMGESAGVYFSAAEAKMREAVMSTRVGLQQPAATANSNVQSAGGTTATATFGIGSVESEDMRDAKALRHLVVRVPIQLRLKTKINVKDLVIQVIFYDVLDGKPTRTNANVSNRWSTAPVDWREDENEVLEVEYVQPLPDPHETKREDRKFYGYLVRVYYKDELQATSAEPSVLGQKFPASQTLEKDSPQ